MDISKYLVGMPLDSHSSVPLYQQISRYIKEKILDNTLAPGVRLPSERELAKLLNVSRTTAINAYRELEREGYVQSKTGSGTYVTYPEDGEDEHPVFSWPQAFKPQNPLPMGSILRELISGPVSEGTIALDAGLPDPSLYPLKQLQQAAAGCLKEAPPRYFGHLPTEGFAPLRSAVASLMASKNVEAAPGHIMITAGAQQALYLLVKALLEPGDSVMVQSPTYIGALQMFQSASVRLLSLPTKDRFPLALAEEYLVRYRPKLMYLVPTHQNPTGSTISEKDRMELINLARRHRLVIVEDDPYGDIYFEKQPPPPLKAFDNYGGVVYVGTFSKVLMPGFRTGYVVAHPALINRLATEKQYADLHSNNLSQVFIHAFLAEGILADHLRQVREAYKKRRDALDKALRRNFASDISYTVPEGGFYFWCRFSRPLNTEKLLQESLKTGVTFVPGQAFYPSGQGEEAIRLCFAATSEELLTEAAGRLKKAYKLTQERSHPAETRFQQSRTIV